MFGRPQGQRAGTNRLGLATPNGEKINAFCGLFVPKVCCNLDVEAPEILVVVELLGGGELPSQDVQVISEECRLVGTPGGRGVGRLDLPPLVLLDIPPAKQDQANGVRLRS